MTLWLWTMRIFAALFLPTEWWLLIGSATRLEAACYSITLAISFWQFTWWWSEHRDLEAQRFRAFDPRGGSDGK